MNEEERREKARDKIFETLSELKGSIEESITLLQDTSIYLSLLPSMDIESYENIVKCALISNRAFKEKLHSLHEQDLKVYKKRETNEQ